MTHYRCTYAPDQDTIYVFEFGMNGNYDMEDAIGTALQQISTDDVANLVNLVGFSILKIETPTDPQ